MGLPALAAALGQGIGALSLIDDVIDAGKSVFNIIAGSGGTAPSQTAVSNVVSGSGIGAVVRSAQAGTSVGPVVGRAIDVGLTVLPPIIAAVQQARSPAIIPPSTLPQDLRGGFAPVAGGPRVMTRKQFILATARANNPGATSKKIIRSARECGIELAAATFGLNVLDVCFLIAQPPTRRARGISAADLRRTRATVRKVHNIEADFREWCKTPVRRRRSK